ncbi:phosphate regulon sensor histidine kinase PhoR [Limnohabitans sp. TEGF004]|nr:phosphate regulon sensor histidine kinase PhoR [Limnohabitans sp. TEGF004]
MISRFLSFLSLLAFGAAIGFSWAVMGDQQLRSLYVLLGALIAGLLWMLVDAWRGYRVRSWLRHGDLAMAPQMSGWWGVVLDRARKLLRDRERNINAGEQRLKDFLSAIQASPNGVLMLDAQAQIEWCNQTAATHLGVHPERDVMQRVGNLLRDPIFTAYMAVENPVDPVVIAGHRHRMERPVLISVQRHRYGEGKQLLLTRDVTLLEQAEAMRRDFVANVSHEIRTPLTVMSGFVETLQTLPLTADEQKRYLALMAVQAVRMQGLVEDLLTLSRLEGSPVPNFLNTTPLMSLLKTCESEARGLSDVISQGAAAQIIQFEVNPLLGGASLMGEARELQSALSNLVSNAVRYTPAGGQIQVNVDQGIDGSLFIAVRDTGPGIAAEHLPRLTERFYRVDRSRSRESGGTGLGLAIVKHVMQRHGGSLSITSEVGQGSCFKLVFPSTRWCQPT